MESLIRRFGPAVVWLLATAWAAAAPGEPANPYAAWRRGPPADPAFFPIAVWLQPPAKAPAYKQAGINTYVGLWRGPTEEQLTVLKQAGLKLICELNEVARRHLEDDTIIGWMHGDEPDNAQSLGEGKGYGPPIPPAQIVADYRRLRGLDPTRPGETDLTLRLRPPARAVTVEVLGEDRRLSLRDGAYRDHFGLWDVHLYRFTSVAKEE
jgi:hypothetical protein